MSRWTSGCCGRQPREGIDQDIDPAALEQRSDEQHRGLSWRRRRCDLADAEVDDLDARFGHPGEAHDLAPRERRGRQHHVRPAGRPRGDLPAPEAFPGGEPFGVGEVGDVVDRQRHRCRTGQRRRVARGEEHIGLVAAERPRELPLFPARAARPGHDPYRPARFGIRRRPMTVEHQFVSGGDAVAPFAQQFGQVPSDSGGTPGQFAGVDRHPHLTRAPGARRSPRRRRSACPPRSPPR